jgi:hypothetical protein
MNSADQCAVQRFYLLRSGFEQAFACRSVEREALKRYGGG